MKQSPNILFILADDMGYGDMAHFGNPYLRTPHLDSLARDGVTLTQHYSASPLCASARAALLTGRCNHRTGAVDVPSNRELDRFALSETAVADIFADNGYATGMIGKWHNGLHDMRYHPNNRGLQEFLGFLHGEGGDVPDIRFFGNATAMNRSLIPTPPCATEPGNSTDHSERVPTVKIRPTPRFTSTV